MPFCSPSVAPCAPLTRPLFFTGVKRGVCSQINHFPEDADFDHDGAEYVLRKSTLQHCKKKLMNDQADGGQTLSHGPIRDCWSNGQAFFIPKGLFVGLVLAPWTIFKPGMVGGRGAGATVP